VAGAILACQTFSGNNPPRSRIASEFGDREARLFHLRKVEIFGFKSFAERTSIVFPGTGIQDNLADKARRLGIPVWQFG